MSRVGIGRAALLVCLVASLGGSVAGQSATKKPAKKRPTAAAPPPAPKPAPAADVKIRTRYTSGAQVSENTTYVKGTRQRVEFPGAVSIEQCDLGRTLLINPAAKTYLVTDHPRDAAAASPAAAAGGEPAQAATSPQAASAPTKGGAVTYLTTLTDTGERRQMFGREARHVITTTTKQATATACDKSAAAVEVDGWYIDFPGAAQCPIPAASAPARPGPGACVDRVESRTTGEAKLGFPLSTKTTVRVGDRDKQETSASSMEVTAFEITTLDAALFDVPAGYSAASSREEMLAGFQAGGGIDRALAGSTADGTGSAAPKAAGVIRIGVLEPVDKSSHKLPTRELRQELAGDVGRAPAEALELAGSSVADAQADAARMQCDYVLYTEIADIKTSKPGRMGSMLKKVSRDGPPRDVHDVKLEYRLYPAGASAPAIADSASATSGGGFNLHSAVHLAMFAGSMYLRFSGIGLLNPMLSNFGGGLGPLAGSGLFDPRTSAMSSLTGLFMTGAAAAVGDGGAAGGAADDAEQVIRQTVAAALVNEARGTIDHLQKGKKQ